MRLPQTRRTYSVEMRSIRRALRNNAHVSGSRLLDSAGRGVAPLDARPLLGPPPHFDCREIRGPRQTLRDTAGGTPDLTGRRREAAAPTSAAYLSGGYVFGVRLALRISAHQKGAIRPAAASRRLKSVLYSNPHLRLL